MSTRLADYNYELPRELIAQYPLPQREDSRMMVLRRDRKKIEHAHFFDFKKFLRDEVKENRTLRDYMKQISDKMLSTFETIAIESSRARSEREVAPRGSRIIDNTHGMGN